MQYSEFDEMVTHMYKLFEFLGDAIKQSNDRDERQEYLNARNRVRSAIQLIEQSSSAAQHAMVRYE